MLKVLRDTIAADRYPLSPRMRTLKSAAAKLDPQQTIAVEPYPPPKAWVNSSIGQRKGARAASSLIEVLLDHLIGAGKQGWRHGDAEALGGLQIDRENEL